MIGCYPHGHFPTTVDSTWTPLQRGGAPVTGDDEWLSALRAIGDAPADAYVAAQLARPAG